MAEVLNDSRHTRAREFIATMVRVEVYRGVVRGGLRCREGEAGILFMQCMSSLHRTIDLFFTVRSPTFRNNIVPNCSEVWNLNTFFSLSFTLCFGIFLSVFDPHSQTLYWRNLLNLLPIYLIDGYKLSLCNFQC